MTSYISKPVYLTSNMVLCRVRRLCVELNKEPIDGIASFNREASIKHANRGKKHVYATVSDSQFDTRVVKQPIVNGRRYG